MFELLHIGERERWNGYLSRIPDADIYYTAEYCEIYQRNGEGEAELFVYEQDEALVCYAYLVRSIDHLPVIASAGAGRPLYDISTPYGYGGPICNVTDLEERKLLFQRFSDVFQDYCRSRNILTEFVRFHPILKNHLDYVTVKPTFTRNTIYIDLTLSEEEMTDRYKPDCRNRIRRALKEDMEIVHRSPSDSERLLKLYYATMDKNAANSYYYFSEEFFRNTLSLLEQHVELMEVVREGETVASAIFLCYNGYLHYHLSGSDKSALKYGPVNLLIDYAAKWGKQNGYNYLHLGGGYLGNDTLYRFKSSFHDRIPLDFYVGKKIHDPVFYETMIKQHEFYDMHGYFPFYRDPKLQLGAALAESKS